MMLTQNRFRLMRVWTTRLILALGLLLGCDEETFPIDEFQHAAIYEVEYRIQAEGGASGALYTSFLADDLRLESAGRIRPPWSEHAWVPSGREARLRGWGLSAGRSVLLEILVYDTVQARVRLSPGGDLKEVRFRLP